MKVNIDKLQTIKNFATKEQVTPSYIYKLVKEKKMSSLSIDGVQFVDTVKYPNIPKKKT